MLIAAMVGLVFGLAPGIQVSGGNVQELLKDGGHTASGGKRHEGLRSTLEYFEKRVAETRSN